MSLIDDHPRIRVRETDLDAQLLDMRLRQERQLFMLVTRAWRTIAVVRSGSVIRRGMRFGGQQANGQVRGQGETKSNQTTWEFGSRGLRDHQP